VGDPRAWERAVTTDVPAVIFKLIRDPWQHGDLAVARSLGRLGVPVVAATRAPEAPSMRSRYVRRHVVVPDPAAGSEVILQILGTVAQRVGGRPVVVPTDDLAALFVSDHEAALRAFRLPEQPPDLPRRLSNKRHLHELCLEAGVPTPEARFPASREEMVSRAAELGFPVVVKGIDPAILRRRTNAVSVALARSADEATALYNAMEDPTEPNLMLQEFIPGGATSVWMFNGYFDRSGACRIGFVGQKIRQAPPRTGATSLGAVVDNPTVDAQAREFLGHVGYRGIVDLGFRFDARDGRYKLLDVNPRIGSSFRLFVGDNGLDVVRALYLDLTDQPIPESHSRNGRRWWVEDQDAATVLKLMRAGELGLRELVGSFRGVEETAWISRDDLRPAAVLLGQIAGHLASRAFRGGTASGR